MRKAGCSILAPAKINLSLKVRGRLPTGYHDLESLVAFADIGDKISIEAASAFSLHLTGPFAADIDNDDNLVRDAHALLEKAIGRILPCRIILEKNLPIAAGLGGGSTDAAATLSGLCRFFELSLKADDLMKIAALLGADVSVCLYAQTCWMTGIGHDIVRLSDLPPCDIILVNPGLGVATGEVFAALGATQKLSAAQAQPPCFVTQETLLNFMAQQGNDLTAPALKIAPVIGECLEILRSVGGLGAAMSGSGASCFALAAPGEGENVKKAYQRQRPQDWSASGRLINGG